MFQVHLTVFYWRKLYGTGQVKMPDAALCKWQVSTAMIFSLPKSKKPKNQKTLQGLKLTYEPSNTNQANDLNR